MRVVVDRDLCEANAVCVGWAPEVFTLGEDNRMAIVKERPGPELAGELQQAVARCPRGALALVPESDAGG
jgi:ferredoxin